MTNSTVTGNASYNGVIPQQTQVKSTQNDIPKRYFLKPNTVTINENNQVQDVTEKKGLSTGAKVAIGAGIITALTLGAELIFCKGKHFKSLFSKTVNKGNQTTNHTKSSHTTTSVPKPPENQTNPLASKINNMREQILSKYEINGEIEKPMTLYSEACRKNYDKIRICSKDFYQLRPTCSQNIDNLVRTNGNNVYVETEGIGWCYRYANKNNGIYPPCIDRISLNVYPEENLIRELDNFISSTRVNAEYKVPEIFAEWQKRHDPITIYFREPIPQDVKDEVIKIVTPYVRPCSDDIMLGKKLANGIYQVAEPTEQDVLALIDRASKLGDDKLVECLKSPEKWFGAELYKYTTDGVKIHTSPGKVKAAEMLIEDLEKICGK